MQKPIRIDSRQSSCTECHRRKQKCISKTANGPCDRCARRFPPVKCFGRQFRGAIQDALIENPVELYAEDLSRTSEQLELADTQRVVLPGSFYKKIIPASKSFLHGNVNSMGGILTQINCTNTPSVDPSLRNTELFYFFYRDLAPTMASLDGHDTPPELETKILPWMMQSPLMPHMALFIASGYRALLQGKDVTKYPEAIAIKGTILAGINDYLKRDFSVIHEPAIQSVDYLALLELYLGDPSHMWAHMRGLKEMLRLQGGLKKIQNSKLRPLLVLTDYMLACSFEQDLCIVDPEDPTLVPRIVSCPETYSCPLFESNTKFQEISKSLGISPVVAKILDDIRFLTTSVLFQSSKSPSDPNDPLHSKKYVQDIAGRILNNVNQLSMLLSSDSSSDNMEEIIRISAVVYTSAIFHALPISLAWTATLRRQLYNSMQHVSIAAWKNIPGIYLWVLFVSSPGSGGTVQGRLLRRNASLVAVYIGFEALGLSVACLRRLWRVQKWISKAGCVPSGDETFLC